MLLFTWIALAYGLISIVWTWPLVLDLASAVPSDTGDPLLNVWTLWWNSRHLPLTSAWWNAPMFYPPTDTLALCEHLAGLSPITTPIIVVSGNPQLAYNIAFLLTFALSAFFAHLLCYRLTGRHDAAFVAGLAFGFAPYRANQLSHLQVLSSFWMPLIFLGLHAYLDEKKARWLWLAGAAFTLQGLSNGYYLLFLPTLLAAWMLWFLPGRRATDTAAVAATLTLAGLTAVPFLVKYQTVAERYGLQRPYGEIEFFSADVTAFFRSHELLAIWNWLPVPRPESGIFTGATCAILVVAAVAYGLTRAYEQSRWRGVRTALATLAVVYTFVTVGTIAVGPWQTNLLGLTIRASGLDKPLTIAFGCWVAYLVLSPRFEDVWRRRSAFAFYVGATLLMWLCALGPIVRFMNQSVVYRPPYWWLLQLPGFDQLRVPARFAMLATLCLAVAAGLAFVRLVSPSTRGRLVVLALVAMGILADGWMTNMPLATAPTDSVVSIDARSGAVMELPLGDDQTDLNAMYRAMRHDRPVVNGYCGHRPPYYGVLRTGLRLEDPSVLEALADLGTRFVVVNEGHETAPRWSRYLMAHPGMKRVAAARGQILYEFPVAGSTPPQAGAPALRIHSVAPNVRADAVQRLNDGDWTTQWTTGRPQQGNEELTVALETSQVVQGIQLALGVFVGDFPADLVIEVSEDGASWKETWRGPTAGPAMLAVLEDPRTSPMQLTFDPVRARFLRLRQIGSAPQRHWSIVELTVLGSS